MSHTENYRDTQIMTASPMELIIMLYNDCIQSLEKAENAFNSEDPNKIEQINNYILHSQNVITELIVSLDMEKGGEIAVNLERLYDFMISNLSNANVVKIASPITEVREMMIDLREAWLEISSQETKLKDEIKTTAVEGILFAG